MDYLIAKGQIVLMTVHYSIGSQKKTSDRELYGLSQIVLSAPCTQVSVERGFSALSYILNDRRLRLTNQNLEIIIFIKLNKSLYENVKIKF